MIAKKNNTFTHIHDSGGISTFLGFLIGAIAGGAFVFLYGTKEGTKIRQTIFHKDGNIFEKLEELISKVEKETSKMEEKTTEVKKEVQKNVTKELEHVEEELEKLPEYLARIQEKGRDLAGGKKKKFFHRSST